MFSVYGLSSCVLCIVYSNTLHCVQHLNIEQLMSVQGQRTLIIWYMAEQCTLYLVQNQFKHCSVLLKIDSLDFLITFCISVKCC